MRHTRARLFVLGFAPVAIHAQAIGGRVLDRETGKPLFGVSVSIPGDSGKPLARQDTRADGIFTLLVPKAGRYQLRFGVAAGVVLVSDSIDVGAEDFAQKDFRLTVPADAVYYDFQVEKPAVPASGNIAPRYPVELRNVGVQGGIIAQFIVDTTGRVRPESFKVLEATHVAFAASVRTALGSMKFLPAERDGRKVAQLVQQPFQFEIGPLNGA